MIPPFGPESAPELGWAVQALFTPLVLLAACASVVWGLQDRYSVVVKTLRELTTEYRDHDQQNRPTALKEMQIFVQRARVIRNAVLLYYLSIILQFVSALFVGFVLLDVWRTMLPAIVFFEASLVTLFAAIVVTIWDTYLSYRDAQAEAQEAGVEL